MQGNRFKDLTNLVFGDLTAIHMNGKNKNKTILWLCKCSCGNVITVPSTTLRNGVKTHCGCKRSENCRKAKQAHNRFSTQGDITFGYDKSGNEFVIDTEDLERVKQYYWSRNSRGYFVNSKHKLFLHRFIMNAQAGEEVDHLYHKTIDNRKSQLRLCTHTENMQNASIYSNNTSGVTGVYNYDNKYRAKISVDGKEKHLGMFECFEDAVTARKEAEKLYYKTECWN